MSIQYHRADPVELEFAFRAMPDGSSTFEGYAAVFNRRSKPISDSLARGRPYRETILPGAFRADIGARRQTFVVDHDEGRMLSSLPDGPLRLSEDAKGLHVESPWPDTSWARDVRAMHDNGQRLGMSILFGVLANQRRPTETPGESWTPDGSIRTVSSAKLKHVSVLAAMEPAYDGTVATFRALADATGAEADDVDALMDALREGRRLDEGEFHLLNRLSEAVRPETVAPAPADVAIPDGVLAMLAKLDRDLPQA